MVHVTMRHEDIANPQKLARPQPCEVAQIEKQRAALKNQIYIEAWVVERIIDE